MLYLFWHHVGDQICFPPHPNLRNTGIVWPSMHPTALLLTHHQQERVSHYALDLSFSCVRGREIEANFILAFYLLAVCGLPLVGFWDRRETPSSEQQPALSFFHNITF